MLTTDITFDKIIEKTKRMLGKNYRGDKEMVPVYSSPTPIEGHTDSFLSISNGGFSNEEVALIKEKTKNYAWWIANKGYLIDSTRKEIPALFIFGSEIGNTAPDVLNCNGLTENGFYLPINRTNIKGEVSDTSNHMYVQFIADGKIKTFETDVIGNNGGVITIDEVAYEFYAGRLYPEDKIIVDSNIYYPIYLVSNLDYYYIPVVGEEGEALNGAHDTEPTERNNLEILEDVCDMVVHEAAQWTNRPANTNLLRDCWPVIVKCACMAYLNRGAEGLNSQSELGQQNVYTDWVSLMHKQVTNRRYVM
jgi:hypothetical protein